MQVLPLLGLLWHARATGDPGAGIAPIAPFERVFKDGYLYVGCMADEMEHIADKHGENRHTYTVATNVSVLWYDLQVGAALRRPMTPKVCFDFCRSQPEMQFFGVTRGRDCYCTPYFQRRPGSGACSAPCEGDPAILCGGKDMVGMYAMHECADTLQNIDETIDIVEEARQAAHYAATVCLWAADQLERSADALMAVSNEGGDMLAHDLAARVNHFCSPLHGQGEIARDAAQALVEPLQALRRLRSGLTRTRIRNKDQMIYEAEKAMAHARALAEAARREEKKAVALSEVVLPDIPLPAKGDRWFRSGEAAAELFEPVLQSAERWGWQEPPWHEDAAGRGLQASCGGEEVGVPKLGLVVSQCAEACEREPDCVAFNHLAFTTAEELADQHRPRPENAAGTASSDSADSASSADKGWTKAVEATKASEVTDDDEDGEDDEDDEAADSAQAFVQRGINDPWDNTKTHAFYYAPDGGKYYDAYLGDVCAAWPLELSRFTSTLVEPDGCGNVEEANTDAGLSLWTCKRGVWALDLSDKRPGDKMTLRVKVRSANEMEKYGESASNEDDTMEVKVDGETVLKFENRGCYPHFCERSVETLRGMVTVEMRSSVTGVNDHMILKGLAVLDGWGCTEGTDKQRERNPGQGGSPLAGYYYAHEKAAAFSDGSYYPYYKAYYRTYYGDSGSRVQGVGDKAVPTAASAIKAQPLCLLLQTVNEVRGYDCDYGSQWRGCQDEGEWHDVGRKAFNCEWYAHNVEFCSPELAGVGRSGASAEEACCACGGGDWSGGESRDQQRAGVPVQRALAQGHQLPLPNVQAKCMARSAWAQRTHVELDDGRGVEEVAGCFGQQLRGTEVDARLGAAESERSRWTRTSPGSPTAPSAAIPKRTLASVHRAEHGGGRGAKLDAKLGAKLDAKHAVKHRAEASARDVAKLRAKLGYKSGVQRGADHMAKLRAKLGVKSGVRSGVVDGVEPSATLRTTHGAEQGGKQREHPLTTTGWRSLRLRGASAHAK